jgi:hypothetical protein
MHPEQADRTAWRQIANRVDQKLMRGDGSVGRNDALREPVPGTCDRNIYSDVSACRAKKSVTKIRAPMNLG